ncbi:hypothetical protein WA158_007280 [Blastocystis sp. Blastoise]
MAGIPNNIQYNINQVSIDPNNKPQQILDPYNNNIEIPSSVHNSIVSPIQPVFPVQPIIPSIPNSNYSNNNMNGIPMASAIPVGMSVNSPSISIPSAIPIGMSVNNPSIPMTVQTIPSAIPISTQNDASNGIPIDISSDSRPMPTMRMRTRNHKMVQIQMDPTQTRVQNIEQARFTPEERQLYRQYHSKHKGFQNTFALGVVDCVYILFKS